MKFVLLSAVCLIAATLAAPASTKKKRDILPGDPRYGTDYHHTHHEHNPHENEVEISEALGGYAGSYTVPESGFDSFNSFQAPSGSYGPPDYIPGKPIHYPEIPSFDDQSVISDVKSFGSVDTISNGYLSPVVQASQTPIVSYNSPAPTYQKHVAPQSNAYLAPQSNAYLAPQSNAYVPPVTPAPQAPAPVVRYTTPAPVVHYTSPAPVVHYTNPAPVVHYTTPAPVVRYTTAAPSYHQHTKSFDNSYLAPAIQTSQQKTIQPVDSYGTPVPEYQASADESSAQNNEGIVVQSHATATSDDSSSDYSVTVGPTVEQKAQLIQEAPVQHEVRTVQEEIHHDEPAVVQDTQVGSQDHVETENHSQVHVQHEAARTVKTGQVQVSQTHRAAQPVVHHQKAVQPAVQQPISYQSVPQTFSSGHFGDGFDNFGTFDSSSFQSSFESPSYSGSSSFIPQTYNTDLSNLGFGHEQLQTYGQQFPQTIQSNFDLSSFGQSPISQLPTYQDTSRFLTTGLENINQAQVQTSLLVNRNAQTSSHAHHELTQRVASNGGYVY